tara:strand:+ start:239 stop:685 length:447 start_codon:yes stop_codon:yes gene_type:complete
LIEDLQFVGIAIGIGMCLSLILTETLGITAGGVIVPGYIALYLHEPFKIFITFGVALIVVLLIKILSNFMFIYGKRRLVLSLLLGFFFGYLSKIYLDPSLSSIGNIIPGLLASWMDRQGIAKTIAVLIIIAVATRLIFIILTRGLFYV